MQKAGFVAQISSYAGSWLRGEGLKKIVYLFTLAKAFVISPAFSAEFDDSQYPWLDELHVNVSESFNDTASWLDDFFADETFNVEQEATGRARIQLAWEPRSRELVEFESRIRVNWKLPNFKNHVDVVFSDYDEELERAPVKAAQNNVLANQNRFNLALRWILKSDAQSIWSHRVGVGRKLQPFVRSRYAEVMALSEKNTVRMEFSSYYYAKDGFGSHLGLQYEHGLTDMSFLRFDNNFYYRDETSDWLWQHSMYNMRQLNDEAALIYGLYLEGNSKPNYQISEYLVSSRWRKNALREWLFFEVEPFVLWRRNEDFSASYGVALRVEGFFGHH